VTVQAVDLEAGLATEALYHTLDSALNLDCDLYVECNLLQTSRVIRNSGQCVPSSRRRMNGLAGLFATQVIRPCAKRETLPRREEVSSCRNPSSRVTYPTAQQ